MHGSINNKKDSYSNLNPSFLPTTHTTCHFFCNYNLRCQHTYTKLNAVLVLLQRNRALLAQRTGNSSSSSSAPTSPLWIRSGGISLLTYSNFLTDSPRGFRTWDQTMQLANLMLQCKISCYLPAMSWESSVCENVSSKNVYMQDWKILNIRWSFSAVLYVEWLNNYMNN